jgi:hypothetical protein
MAFKKGQSGNPKGRPPKGHAITDLLNKYLCETAPGDKVERKQKLIEAMFKHAVEGDTTAMKYIVDRIDGKIPDTVNLSVNSFSDWVKSVADEE